MTSKFLISIPILSLAIACGDDHDSASLPLPITGSETDGGHAEGNRKSRTGQGRSASEEGRASENTTADAGGQPSDDSTPGRSSREAAAAGSGGDDEEPVEDRSDETSPDTSDPHRAADTPDAGNTAMGQAMEQAMEHDVADEEGTEPVPAGDDEPDDNPPGSIDSALLTPIACGSVQIQVSHGDSPQCDALSECLATSCDARLAVCLGKDSGSGRNTGPCAEYYACAAEQDDPCSAACEVDNECVNCITRELNQCRTQACGDAYTACTGLPLASEELPARTCADLADCCAQLDAPLQSACSTVVERGLDASCDGAYDTFCR